MTSFARILLVGPLLSITAVVACGDDGATGGAASTTGAGPTGPGPAGSGAKSSSASGNASSASGSTSPGAGSGASQSSSQVGTGGGTTDASSAAATSGADATSVAATSGAAATTAAATSGAAATSVAATSGAAATTAASGGPLSGTGIEFAPNYQPGSDARLVWSGADMIPRRSHTVIWQARYAQQSGYYAVAWHTSNDGTWHASLFEYGTHPYPTTGTVNADGQSTGGTSSFGLVHFYEIAGLGASDFIASPGPGPTYEVQKDVWVMQARVAETVGNQVHHRYWPDLTQPGAYIEQIKPKADIEQGENMASSPAFTIGGSPWTGDGVSNGESPCAVLRNFMLFDEPLSIADIVAEANGQTDAATTNAGMQSVWYVNRNPTPDDVSDKSGAGHSPTWANAQRPGLYVMP